MSELAETPVATSLTPLSTSAELAAARTSHLDHFNPGKVDAESAVDGPMPYQVPADSKFPASIKQTMKLLEEIRATPAEGKREQEIKAAQLRAVAEHLHKIQQVPTPPPLTRMQMASLSQTQTNHAKSIHLDDLARQFPEVRALLDERDELLEKLTNPKSKK